MGRLWKCHLFVLILKCWCFFSVAVVEVNVSMSKILSVTRSRGKGDSFEIELESNGCLSCQQYGASQTNNVTGSRCSCSCKEKGKSTFYTTHRGEVSCMKDIDILADVRRGNTCYIDRSQQLKVLNLQVNGQEQLGSNGPCDQIKITDWKLYLNSSWTSFPADDAFPQRRKPHSATIFSWNGNPDFLYQGFLIKVMFQCTYKGQTNIRCLIFKAEGTHQYFNISTATPPVVKPTYTSTEKSSVETSNEENAETKYSKANEKKIWMALSLGLSGVVLIAIIAIVVFLVLRFRRNCKQETTEPRRHPPEQPSESAVCSPLHDYEYVHYPCLVNGLRSPRKATENALYERGEDNKLIIWTPGHSGTLTRSAETAAPRLPYQRLLTRTSSSTPDSTTGIRPVSSLGMETDFPYQKLVRATASLPRTAGTSSSSPDCANVVSPTKSALVEEDVFPYQELFRSTPSLKGEAPWLECGQKRLSEVESNGEGVSTTPYHCLSLQRNQLYPLDEFDGYARVEGVDPQTEDLEYDYARVEVDPVELRNLFRISHSDDAVNNIPNTCMEVTIGDLSNTSSTPNTIVSESSPSQSCRGDSDSCAFEDIVERKRDCCMHGNEWLKPQNLRPAASYEDLSRGRPEEYEEMGKRRSVMMVEDNEATEIEEDNGHEYYVLEPVVECDEGETDDAH